MVLSSSQGTGHAGRIRFTVLSNAVTGASAKLQLVADGVPAFCSDHKLLACVE